MKRIYVLLLITCFLGSSCAQMNGVGQKDIIGTGAGAATGAVLGQIFGQDTKSTLIGAAVGGVLGYFIASNIKTQTNQVYNQQKTKQLITQNGKQGKVVQVHSQSVEPSTQFHPGDVVTVRFRYIVMDPHQYEVAVHETKSLWYHGAKKAVFEDQTITRENGTYESTISFQIATDAKKGNYVIRQDLNSGHVSDSSLAQFSVI